MEDVSVHKKVLAPDAVKPSNTAKALGEVVDRLLDLHKLRAARLSTAVERGLGRGQGL
jgi:hypothetical protein